MIRGDFQRTKVGTGTRTFYTSRRRAEQNRTEQNRSEQTWGFELQDYLGREGSNERRAGRVAEIEATPQS